MFLKNESGNALVVFLIMLPLLIMIITASIEITDTVTVSDIDVQNSLANACKSAAGQISVASQANAAPRINSQNALDEFTKSLQYNLRLDENMLPLPGTHYKTAPEFWVLVYNGYSDYAWDGANLVDYWRFDGTNLIRESFAASGLPASFFVSEGGIGSSGNYRVDLATPGVVGVLRIEKRNVLGAVPVVVTRWASARIIWKNL